MDELYNRQIDDLKKSVALLKGRTTILWMTCIVLTAVTTALFMHVFIL